MLVIDNHIHLGKPGVHVSEWMYNELRKNWDNRGFRYNTEELKTERRDAGGLVEIMDAAGIDVCCVMAGNWNRVLSPEQRPYDVPHELVYETVRTNPARFVGIASADPIADPWGAAEEVERVVKDWGFRAVKLYPTYAHFDPRDERCYPLYETCIALDVPVHFHMGWTSVCTAKMEFQPPRLLDDVGRNFPKLKVVICHMGQPHTEECAGIVARHENFHCDLSGIGFWHPEKVYRIIHDFGCLNPFDKLLYGSENPFMTKFHKTLMDINRTARQYGYPEIPEPELEKILGLNAVRLYKLDRAKLGRSAG